MHRLATIAITTIAAALCGCATQRAVVPVKATELLRTEKSWDGKPLPEYPQGTPELVVVRYEVAPGAKLGWHHHPSINYGIIEQGETYSQVIFYKEGFTYDVVKNDFDYNVVLVTEVDKLSYFKNYTEAIK